MEYHTLTRVHYQPEHALAEEQLTAHPDPLGRILYFALPFLFAFIVNAVLFSRNQRIHQNNFVRVYPANTYTFLVVLLAIVGAAVIGIYAVIADAWNVREWILFSVICGVVGLKAIIYTADKDVTLFVTIWATCFAAIVSQWLFVQLRDMVENTQDQIGWKHVTRNLVGFSEALFIIFTVVYLSETLVHLFKVSERCASYIFWIFAPLLTILVLVWNILSFGPFLDSIGYIVAALILFLGAAVNTLFYKEEEREGLPLRK